MRPLNRKKSQAGVTLTLLLSGVVYALLASGALDRLEWITYDYRMQLHRQEKRLHPDLAVVLIDEASLQTLNPLVGRYPWPRSVYADLLEFLAEGGARAVVFDILFTENEGDRGTLHPSDAQLIATSGRTGIAYHAAQVLKDEPTEDNRHSLHRPLPVSFTGRHALPHHQGFPDRGNNSFRLPLDGLHQASQGVGVVGMDADADGIYRRVPLFFPYQGHLLPALSIAPLLDRSERISRTANKVRLERHAIPLDADGRFLVNMVGRFEPYSLGGIFASIAALRAGEVERMLVYPDEFEGKIVFVGASAVGLEDIKTTPLSPLTPGVYIHASASSNVLDQEFLQPVGLAATMVVVTLFIALTAGGILAFSRFYLQLAAPLGLALAFAAYTFWQFGVGRVLHATGPLVAIGLAWFSTFAYVAFTEGKDKRRVRTMLSQYVSPAMLTTVLDRYEDHLKAEIGTKEHLSILFSDVRGFTAISERLPAEHVVDLLNTHFSVMTDIIFRYEGTLDKFIGDAIMAFWGAPIRIGDHADRSVQAAIEMTRGIAEVNRRLEAKGYPAIKIGIGINSGEVILGNIGSEKKLDYTVIGDNVNLASRLEGLTKQYGCPVIISEFTHQELTQPIPCATVDLVRVKGKQVPIRIYWPLALPGDPPESVEEATRLAALIERAFALYMAQRWGEAMALYAQLPPVRLREVFLERCENYRVAPPPGDWDGVFTLTTK